MAVFPSRLEEVMARYNLRPTDQSGAYAPLVEALTPHKLRVTRADGTIHECDERVLIKIAPNRDEVRLQRAAIVALLCYRQPVMLTTSTATPITTCSEATASQAITSTSTASAPCVAPSEIVLSREHQVRATNNRLRPKPSPRLFRVPRIYAADDNPTRPYLITGIVHGDSLKSRFTAPTAESPAVHHDIATILLHIGELYPVVLAEYEQRYGLPTIDPFWETLIAFKKLFGWEQQTHGTLDTKTLKAIGLRIVSLAWDMGTELFGFAHGDIHSEHVWVDKEDGMPYLTDLNLVLRLGANGLHDQIRSLISMLAHSPHPQIWEEVILPKFAELAQAHGEKLVCTLSAFYMVQIIRDIRKDAEKGKSTTDLAIERTKVARRAIDKILQQNI